MKLYRVLEDFRFPEKRKITYLVKFLDTFQSMEIHAYSPKRAAELWFHDVTNYYELGAAFGNAENKSGQTYESVKDCLDSVIIVSASSEKRYFFRFQVNDSYGSNIRDLFRKRALEESKEAYDRIYGGRSK